MTAYLIVGAIALYVIGLTVLRIYNPQLYRRWVGTTSVIGLVLMLLLALIARLG
jgi:hypothetical protein